MKAEAQEFHISNFSGPLDLLLFLIRKNEMSIYDIPISEITSQYLEVLARQVNIEYASEFFAMAATLMYIKSKMLLPHTEIDMDDFEDPRKDLADKLIEYQKFKKLTELLEQPLDLRRWIRKRREFQLEYEELNYLDAKSLYNAFYNVMKNLLPERIFNILEEISVHEKIILIREKLQLASECTFSELISNPNSVFEIIASFIAVLELTKSHVVTIYQEFLLGEIRICSTM